MSVICPGCRNTVEVDVAGNCPQCAQPLVSPGQGTMAGTPSPPGAQNRPPPAPSVMAEGDAELLSHGSIRAPSRLGSLGRAGKFELIRELGRGGMARVFLATEPVTGVSVALKVLQNELAEDPRVVKAFLSEARHMYELSHPNILKVLEVSSTEDEAFFVMPLVRGGSLQEHIPADGMPADRVLAISSQVAEGLVHAHGRGLLHRDLKPANVLLDESGRAMIADFGLVKPFFNDTMLEVQPGSPAGTPAYMSPRVAAGLAEDTRADIYAFGAMMYEMLSGRSPFAGHNPAAVLQAVIDGPPEPLAAVAPTAPAGLVAIADRCMARELRDRYATMGDVLDDLRRVAAHRAPRGPHGHGSRGAPGRRLAVAALAVLIVVGLGLVGFLGARLQRGSEDAPGNEDAAAGDLYRQGLEVYAQGRYPEGTELLKRAHQADPANAEINRVLVDHLTEMGHTQPARMVLQTWLKADPGNSEASKLLAGLDAAPSSPGGQPPQGPPDGPPSREPRDGPPHPGPAGRGPGRMGGGRLPPPRPEAP